MRNTGNVVLVLTATVTPNVRGGVVCDNKIRLKMYLDAIEWYISNTSYKIVVAENSGAQIGNLFCERQLENRLEFIEWSEQPDVPDWGKSYKEMKILEKVWQQSRFVRLMDAIIVKITGRLKVLNITRMVNLVLMCRTLRRDSGDFVSCFEHPSEPMADSRVFFCSYNFMRYLTAHKEMVDNEQWDIEHILSYLVWHLPKGATFYYMPYARLSGVCGGSGRVYDVAGAKLVRQYISHIRCVYKYFFRRYVLHTRKSREYYGNPFVRAK